MRRIEGVPLVPAPRNQWAACQQLANRLGRSVPCPSLVPNPIPTSPRELYCRDPGACGPADISLFATTLLLTQMNFQVPAGYVGVSIDTNHGFVPAVSSVGGSLGHFVFETGTHLLGEYRPHSLRVGSAIPSYCAAIKGRPAVQIHGSTGRFFECANTSSDRDARTTILGHDLLQWKEGPIVCQVSFHGHSQVNLDLDLAVAKSVRSVRPTR